MKVFRYLTLILLTLIPWHAFSQSEVRVSGPDQAKHAICLTNHMLVTTNYGRAYSITCLNNSSADVYLLVFDSNATNAAGAYPCVPAVPIPANSVGGYEWSQGKKFTNGIYVGASSTPVTYTNAGKYFIISAEWYGKAN